MKVINLFGSPGSGKSTLRAGLFYEMKIAGYNVEEVTEYAKDMVWENRTNIFNDQLYMLGKQNRKLLRLEGKVDYVITDSPVILGTMYMDGMNAPYVNTLTNLVVEVFKSYDNYNFLLHREHDYIELGRNQNEQEAELLFANIRKLLSDNNFDYIDLYSKDITPKKLLYNLIYSNIIK